MAIKWNVEAEYLAVSENVMETLLVTRGRLNKMYWFKQVSKMPWNFSNSKWRLGMSRNTIMDALEVCDTVPVALPLKVKATNLEYGMWLITSAQANFEFKENYMDATTLAGSKSQRM